MATILDDVPNLPKNDPKKFRLLVILQNETQVCLRAQPAASRGVGALSACFLLADPRQNIFPHLLVDGDFLAIDRDRVQADRIDLC